MAETNGHKIEVPKSIETSLSHKEEQWLTQEPLRVEFTASEFDASKRKRRRRLCGCFISCGVFTIILGIIILILALTVFKTKDPKITLNSVKIGHLKTKIDLAALKAHLNLTLTADMSIKNTNKAASFKHANSTATMMYQGKTVGQAVIPAGKLKADQTARMNVSVTVFLDAFVSNVAQLINDAFSGSLDMSAKTHMTGRVTILHLVKKHVNVVSLCDITVDVSSMKVKTQKCKNSYKL
ncbi:hypothetical protein SUGI_0776290 [Cryptomeria japonica]|nr:hypothetical protein SUGI_0776290 [Cryptomeria japonica]